MHPVAQQSLSSFAEDAALVDIDIDVGEVHALALARAGLFRPRELRRVLRAYEHARTSVRRLLSRQPRAGAFHDIHPLVEKKVQDSCGGEIGGRVHLGKSRNDQVATDICVYARRQTLAVTAEAAGLQKALAEAAHRYRSEPMPAYTHSRPAQPTTVGHYLLSYVEALHRDAGRLLSAYDRLNFSPLGAAAVAGTSVPVDRRFTARLLGFKGVWLNALDATSARDHVLELLAALAIIQNTLSRLAADLMFFSADEHGVFAYPDELADTSSAMPQKKNPDPLELVRGRAGTLAGALSGALAITHGLPSGYSRDLQELKPALWKSLALVRESAAVVRLTVERLAIQPGRATGILERGYAAALDLAESMCLRKGLPFRRVHYAVGQLVKSLHDERRTFEETSAAEASRILSRGVGRPVTFTTGEWREAVDLERGAGRRKAGGPGDMPRLLRQAAGHVRWLNRAVRSLTAVETRSQRALRAAVRGRT